MTKLRPDLQIIADNIAPGSRVLDIGCGDGALMAALRDEKGCDARGLEIDPVNVASAVGKGLSVVQGDADTDLATYPDGSFDYAILSQTLQTTHRPDVMLDQLLRIGTIDDLRALVQDGKYAQEGQWFLSGDKQTGRGMANLLAEHAVFLLRG